MHIGHNLSTEYFMDNNEGIRVKIEEITIEKDLGIYITNDLKPNIQCSKAAGKARSILVMVKRNFKRLDEEDFLIIYKTYIRPHMEYCVQTWSPHLAKYIQTLEKVQRSATKLVSSLKKLSYETRQNKLGLLTLEKRGIRGDLIETYKIINGVENVKINQFFEFSNTGYILRGHDKKLLINRSRLNTRQFFFSNRVARHWNNLTQEVVNALSVNSFKNRLHQHWRRDLGI